MDGRPQTAEAGGTTGNHIEEKVIAFAEQLGRLVGTVQAKAEGWFDRAEIAKELTRIRDGASDLLAQVMPGNAARRPAAAAATPAARKSRGPVDAPGKKHRKPPPQQRIGARGTGEPRGKQMGQKTVKRGGRGGRS